MKQTINYAITILLWVVAIVLWANGTFPYLGWFLLALHLVELIVTGFSTGRKYGVGTTKSIVMCIIFGYTWWLPLRRQMKAETFSEADFVREA